MFFTLLFCFVLGTGSLVAQKGRELLVFEVDDLELLVLWPPPPNDSILCVLPKVTLQT